MTWNNKLVMFASMFCLKDVYHFDEGQILINIFASILRQIPSNEKIIILFKYSLILWFITRIFLLIDVKRILALKNENIVYKLAFFVPEYSWETASSYILWC